MFTKAFIYPLVVCMAFTVDLILRVSIMKLPYKQNDIKACFVKTSVTNISSMGYEKKFSFDEFYFFVNVVVSF